MHEKFLSLLPGNTMNKQFQEKDLINKLTGLILNF